MATRIYPPKSIRVLSYDKVFFDKLDEPEWRFAVQNAIVIDGTAYLTSWVNTAEDSYRKVYW